jgi:lysozyme
MESFNGYLLRPIKKLFLSTNGTNFIKAWEGWSPNVYLDSADNPTIGYGHKICDRCSMDDPRVEEFSAGIDESYASKLLNDDVGYAEAKTRRILTDATILTQGMYDALVSLTFNTGGNPGWQVYALTKAGDYRRAAPEFLDINQADNQVIEGLTRRRRAEHDTYLRASYRGP